MHDVGSIYIQAHRTSSVSFLTGGVLFPLVTEALRRLFGCQ